MDYIVACPDRALLDALCAFADHMAGVAAFTHDHRAWFRLWLPLGEATPSRDTYLRLVRRLDPETAVKAALWRLDGTRLSSRGSWSWPWTARWPAGRATRPRARAPCTW